jgi:hypothetical protein
MNRFEDSSHQRVMIVITELLFRLLRYTQSVVSTFPRVPLHHVTSQTTGRYLRSPVSIRSGPIT